MNPFAILADDLTGASDTGVQFSRRGARVLVVISGQDAAAPRGGPWDVVVLNTESRHLPAAEARQRAAQGVAWLVGAGWPVRYKKIDSTLRGNVAVELEPLLAQPEHRVVVAPAFPLTGRTVEDGVLKVDGTPVDQTEIGRDRLTPVPESHLPTLLRAHLAQPVGQVGPEALAGGAAGVAAHLGALRERVVVADATGQEHLSWLAEALLPDWERTVVVGSAGMARELARLLLPEEGVAPAHVATQGDDGRPVLVVAGSRTEVTRGQVERLCARPGAHALALPPEHFDRAPPPDGGRAWLDAQVATLADAAARGKRCLVVSLRPMARADASGEDAGFQARSARINRALGALTAALCARSPLAGLVLTGGDIARAVLGALDARGLHLGPELLPGIPLGWAVGGRQPGLPIVTKAGGFGGPEALDTVVGALLSPPAVPAKPTAPETSA